MRMKSKLHRKEQKKAECKRVKWTTVEVEELHKYFKEHFKSKTTPGKKECMSAIRMSKSSGGQLHRRNYHTIVKTISNLNHKD